MRGKLVCVAAVTLAWAPAAQAQGGEPLTVYSSLPLSGDLRPYTRDVVRGAQMALDDAGGQVGGRVVRLVSLDSATDEAGTWDPRTTHDNARKAAADPATAGYIGEFNSGASAISMPVLNKAGIPQVSPSNTYVGLTRRHKYAAAPYEPGVYYPTGRRHYVRVAPADHRAAVAIATLVKRMGVRRVALVDDGEVYGRGLAFLVRGELRRDRIRTVRHLTLARRPERVPRVVRALRGVRAGAMIFTGITQNGAVSLWRGAAKANKRWRLIGADGVLDAGFTQAIPQAAARRTWLLDPAGDPARMPPASLAFQKRFTERHGSEPNPYAMFGYEAMALLIDAMKRAGDPANRAAVIAALFATRQRDSILGRYSIDRFGDTTLRRYGTWRINGGGGLSSGNFLRLPR